MLSLFPTGAFHGEAVTRFQPAKMAAMEGLFTTQHGAPLAIYRVWKGKSGQVYS